MSHTPKHMARPGGDGSRTANGTVDGVTSHGADDGRATTGWPGHGDTADGGSAYLPSSRRSGFAPPTSGNGSSGDPAPPWAQAPHPEAARPPHSHGPHVPEPARVADQRPDEPAPEMIFKRSVHPVAMLRELLGAKELIAALTERDFRARYKQTKVGVAWAVLTPLLLMAAFSIFAHTAADIDTDGIPYALFAYVGLVPWTFFSNGVSAGSVAITGNLSLVNKVYCPREVFPLSAIGIAAVDGLISLSILAFLFVGFGEMPQATTVWVPVLFAVQLMFLVGVTLLLSALVVYLRDVRQILPMALQFALFATPVAYGFDVIDERWQPLASAINPLAPIIDGYRRAVLSGVPPEWDLVGIAAAISLAWLVGGYLSFKRLETGFADVA